LGIKIWESGFGNQDLGIRIWKSGYGNQDLGIKIWESGLGNQDLGIRIWKSGIGNQGLGIRIWKSRFGNKDLGIGILKKPFLTSWTSHISTYRGQKLSIEESCVIANYWDETCQKLVSLCKNRFISFSPLFLDPQSLASALENTPSSRIRWAEQKFENGKTFVGSLATHSHTACFLFSRRKRMLDVHKSKMSNCRGKKKCLKKRELSTTPWLRKVLKHKVGGNVDWLLWDQNYFILFLLNKSKSHF